MDYGITVQLCRRGKKTDIQLGINPPPKTRCHLSM